MATEQSNHRISETLSIEFGALPKAELIFLSINSYGTPGELNSLILGQMHVGTRLLPGPDELQQGYAVVRAGQKLFCFIVTVTHTAAANENLPVNLDKALRDEAVHGAHSMWLPLMGTGAGGLSFEESLELTIEALRSSGQINRPDMRVVIAPPEKMGRSERHSFLREIEKTKANFAATGKGLASTTPGNLPSLSPAASAALCFATALGTLRGSAADHVSTRMLFFALAESGSSFAPLALSMDFHGRFFRGAVLEVAGSRYDDAWKAYFSMPRPEKALALGDIAPPTTNIKRILEEASSASGAIIDVSHLVDALLNSHGSFHDAIHDMGATVEEIRREYRDAMRGKIKCSLHNDVAGAEDELGYARYAYAIARFLSDEATTAPLSVSIQAPWGVGKSTLMKLIDSELKKKPDASVQNDKGEDKSKPEAGNRKMPRASSRLLLGSVIKMLEREDRFVVEADKGVARTVWFNAWKYQTSEQIWSGLVDAIVSQVAATLEPVEREKFFLKLHLSRIDDGIVRRKIYDRVATLWWSKARAWLVAGLGALASLLGLGAATSLLPEAIKWFGQIIAYGGSAALPVALTFVLSRIYFRSKEKVQNEPAAFSLTEFLRVPDYGKAVGDIHQIDADLRRLLEIIGDRTGKKPSAPLVIFIDDLDRCSPGKVASVVEGISMLLGSQTYRCLFVIGMDPQLVAAALEKAHEEVRKQLPRHERSVRLGWRFMDKFVQLPFTIPPCSNTNLSAFVRGLGGIVPTGAATSAAVGETPLEKKKTPLGSTIETTAENPLNEKAQPVAPPTPKPAPDEFDECRDVGRIVEHMYPYAMGNPREIKRMINLARLYLLLRNERRNGDAAWLAPGLKQYAHWIVLSLRWPDMMRWLQWGADEGIWSGNDDDALVTRRLRFLENAAASTKSLKDWSKKISDELLISIDFGADWACDQRLYEFFVREANEDAPTRLSSASIRGFW